MSTLCKLKSATEILVFAGSLTWLETDKAGEALEPEWGTRKIHVGATGRD